ncbi:hypothetical protein AVEN_245731-1 [Araneus ventricosus]|uniref:Transposase Tc1-like domain-containing protein n=1 Tax=Araneus ventricosus TaxID=182803 RepID=A0A4Y2LCK9_ARAVE|nr:hypothetical protein AVEN_245731-1 [Araneus ventricosus]
MGMCSRRPTRVTLLTKCHRQLRPQWAREHRDWTLDERKRVAWSDESDFSFITSMIVSGYAVCQANSCSPLVQQAGGGGIMLWETFSWAVLGPVVVVEQTMKAAN